MNHVLHGCPNLGGMRHRPDFTGEETLTTGYLKDHTEEQIAFDVPWHRYLKLLDENNKNYKEKPKMDRHFESYDAAPLLKLKPSQSDDELFDLNDSCFDLFPEIEDIPFEKESLHNRWKAIWKRTQLSFISAFNQIAAR